MPKDNSKIGAVETVEVEVVEGVVPASRPAIESGPHLKDPANRAAKRAQMIAAGMTVDDEDLSDDMREILLEKE